MQGNSCYRQASIYFSLPTVLIVTLGLLVACGDQTQTPTPTTAQPNTTQTNTTQVATANQNTTQSSTSAAATTTTSTTDAATTQAAIPAGYFQNPVLQSDFPDPYVLRVGNNFYAYATNANGKNIQLATSTDLVNWDLQGDAMPALPKWAKLSGSYVWAPEVAQVGNRYNLYYTARDKASNKQCVGVASSDKPEGKFKDNSDKPLVCHPDEGGDIDQDIFRDGDKLYLYFKNDGNCCSMPTHIYVQELSPDGLSVVGSPTLLISNDQVWEGRVVEAPSMFKHDNNYYLFFSGNDYAGFDYAVGYATCKSAVGPCVQADENPILKSVTKPPLVIGPGHQALLQLGDQTWIFYHAWEVSSSGTKTDRRQLWMDRVDWKDGKPIVNGPTTAPQLMPKINP